MAAGGQAVLRVPAALAVASRVSMNQMMVVTCPASASAGAPIQIQTPTGQMMQVVVPAGVMPGMQFQVAVPAPAPQMAVANPAAAVMAAPLMASPQMAVTAQPQMMMATPPQVMHVQAAPPPASDYRVLAQFGDLSIQQQVDILEAFTGFEEANRYDIFGSLPGLGLQHICHAAEESECCQRQLCGPGRAFTIKIFNNPHSPLIFIDRPFKCCAGKCLLPCEAFLQELHVYAGGPAGQQLGSIRQAFSCAGVELDVLVGGQLVRRILGPLCVCDGPCCGDQVFQIVTPHDNMPIATPAGAAEIRKMGASDFAGMMQEQFTNADNFGARFPPDASPEEKAVILACVFLIDFMFFESQSPNQQQHGGFMGAD